MKDEMSWSRPVTTNTARGVRSNLMMMMVLELQAAQELGQALLAQLQQLRQVVSLVQDGEDVLGGHPGQLGHQVLDLYIESATTTQ